MRIYIYIKCFNLKGEYSYIYIFYWLASDAHEVLCIKKFFFKNNIKF